MKTCKHCGETKPFSDFSPASQCRDGLRPECKSCHNAAEKARDKSHRVTASTAYKREERLRRVYGITTEQYEQMLEEQSGLCAICSGPSSWNRREGEVLVVDHDHDTGLVRSLLCHACNQALGLMKESPDRLVAAAAYLVRHESQAGRRDRQRQEQGGTQCPTRQASLR